MKYLSALVLTVIISLSASAAIYDNYKETSGCVNGTVVYEGKGDYYIIETTRGFTITELFKGRLDEDDKVRGELNSFNFKYILNQSRSREARVYIEDYKLTYNQAFNWLGEKNKLKSDDQNTYDEQKNLK